MGKHLDLVPYHINPSERHSEEMDGWIERGRERSEIKTMKSTVTSAVLYLSLEAFNSRTASLKEAPSSALARQRMLVVLPVPGGPYSK